ncbi:hypothetical protein [Endozoicomonas sp.]|uniref:hypothetical protein n=1 Tax=Endozoicomonas sp. TaxID=1892382 RepID=UPI003AF5C5B1
MFARLDAANAKLAQHNSSQADQRMSNIDQREKSYNGLKVAYQKGEKNIPDLWSAEHSKAYAASGWYYDGGLHPQGKNASDWVKCFPCGHGRPIQNDGLKALNDAHDRDPITKSCSNRSVRAAQGEVLPHCSREIYYAESSEASRQTSLRWYQG